MVSENKKDLSYRGPELKLFFRDVRDRQGKKRAFTVRSWATIKDVKNAIHRLIQVPPHLQLLYFGPLLTSGGELPNHRTLHDVGIYRSGETLLLDIKRNAVLGNATAFYSMSSLSSYGNDVCISTSMIDSTPRPLRQIVQLTRRAFSLGLKPELVLDGSGGTYFMHDARKNKIAVFKPADEEPYADNNPRGYLRQPGQPDSLREGIAPGEACIREVAAFLLDHDGFGSVPMTTLAEARHPAFNSNGARLKVAEGGASVGSHSIGPTSPAGGGPMKKVGSFQEFIRCECSMDDLSPSMLSVDQVHKIAILDIRLLNADRNPANLLCRRKPDDTFELVPIDHGYCLRSVCDVSWMDWCWLDWPQLKQPLSAKSKEYIKNLDIEADARILQERLNICEKAIDNFRASSALMKAGVKAGLNLHQIAVMCCRNDNLAEKPSLLERLTSMASELALSAVVNDQWHHTTASRALVEQLSPKRSSIRSRDRSSGSWFHRSVSSAEFSVPSSAPSSESGSAASELSKALMAQEDRQSPPMAQSSASDSSTGTGEGDGAADKEEVEEWAHNIVEDSFVCFHEEVLATAGRAAAGQRCSSITSDDASSEDSNLSSSPKGFWHVRPGSSPPDNLSDEGSICWSPRSSPSLVGVVGDLSEAPIDPPPLSLVSPEPMDKRRRSVKFADPLSTAGAGTIFPPATVDVSVFKSSVTTEPSGLGIQRQDSGGMTRSKSYSALTRSFSTASASQEEYAAPRPEYSEDHEHFRTYFLKFIDLVIVREMTRESTMNALKQSN